MKNNYTMIKLWLMISHMSFMINEWNVPHHWHIIVPHTIPITLGGGRVVNNVFPHPLLDWKKRYFYCADLTLIPSAFLETTSAIVVFLSNRINQPR
jgi:hypothetical protein